MEVTFIYCSMQSGQYFTRFSWSLWEIISEVVPQGCAAGHCQLGPTMVPPEGWQSGITFLMGILEGQHNAGLLSAVHNTVLYDKRISLYTLSPIHFEEQDV